MANIHKAIRALYPSVVSIEQEPTEMLIKDVNGNDVTVDMEAVNAWLDPEEYIFNRQQEYPSIKEQLDYIYHNGVEAWKTDMILPVKNKYPKGSE
jgi:hypothetical protein